MDTPTNSGTAASPGLTAADEDGSLVTEYGLLTVLGGTVVALAIKFVSNGALWELLGAVLAKARGLVGT